MYHYRVRLLPSFIHSFIHHAHLFVCVLLSLSLSLPLHLFLRFLIHACPWKHLPFTPSSSSCHIPTLPILPVKPASGPPHGALRSFSLRSYRTAPHLPATHPSVSSCPPFLYSIAQHAAHPTVIEPCSRLFVKVRTTFAVLYTVGVSATGGD